MKVYQKINEKKFMKANQALLYQHVEFLTSLRPYRNYKNLESLEEVCSYLKEQFKTYGLEYEEQVFNVGGSDYKNIIGTFNGDKERRLIVSAHYDVCGDQPGADDNASAVSGLLESARMVSDANPELDYRIDFVAFCLEEPPFFGSQQMGSYVHAKSLAAIKKYLIGVINLEMIGFFHDGPQEYPHESLKTVYPETANFIAVVGKQNYHEFNKKVYGLMKVDAGIDVQMIDHPMVESLAGMSDQRSYWEFNIPALMINDTSFIRNPHYHEMSDDIDTLSFEHMREVVNCTYQSITGL